ncbi:LOW QUALITY PROTEIN: hypothetical protein YC2023_104608 [Brassica napus]
MANPWFLSSNASALSPSRFTAGDGSIPPDPPDPDFPPLSSPSPKPPRASLQTAKPKRPVVKSSSSLPNSTVAASRSAGPASIVTIVLSIPHLNLETLYQTLFLQTLTPSKFSPPKHSSPMQTNRASNPSSPLSKTFTHPLPLNPSVLGSPPYSNSPSLPAHNLSAQPSSSNLPPPVSPVAPPIGLPPNGNTAGPSSSAPPLVEKIRRMEDKKLRRLAPVTLSDKGVPRVLIPDSVFQKGAEIHKDFIICYFNGRPPPLYQIQSVLNHMWGKGKRIEIHTNPLSRSMLVRIPSEFLRSKILEKSVWYVGESMFHAVQWSSSASPSSPSLESIQIWAHLTGVPLDLRHEEGLSLVAGLVGDPKETDDFTKNLVSLTLSHVKVAVDLTKPLPSVVEFMRESGEVVEVQVSYPWVLPTCSHCKELGHVMRNCLQLPPPQKNKEKPAKSDNNPSASGTPKGTAKSAKVSSGTANIVESSPSGSKQADSAPTPSVPSPSIPSPPTEMILDSSPSLPIPPLIPIDSNSLAVLSSFPSPSVKTPPASSAPLVSLPASQSNPLSPPDSFFAPSLKRPRPDPNLSFPSFSAQLSYFTPPSPTKALSLTNHSPSIFGPSPNPFSVLDPDGSLHHEETID